MIFFKKHSLFRKIVICCLIFAAVLALGVLTTIYISDHVILPGYDVDRMQIGAILYTASVIAVCTYLLWEKDKK